MQTGGKGDLRFQFVQDHAFPTNASEIQPIHPVGCVGTGLTTIYQRNSWTPWFARTQVLDEYLVNTFQPVRVST